MKLTACMVFILALFSIGRPEIALKDIEVSRHGDSVYIDIAATKPCNYEHFMMKNAPERIVVDLKGTLNDWPRKVFSDLPCKSFERIRTSQFQTDPELVTRVVLDINRPIGYTATQIPLGVRIAIPAVKGEKSFIPWHAKKIRPTKTVTSAEQAPPVRTRKPARAAPKIKTKKRVSVKIDSYPKRKLVRYKTGNSRDPFKPLIGTGKSTITSGEVPAIENLTLVGVFDDEAGKKALFEDAEGDGYLLRPGDRVQNGYLVAVKSKKVIFQVTEYGWTRTVALRLQEPGIK